MKRLIAVLIGAGALGLLGGGPALAVADLPWCVGVGNGEYFDCSYYTLQQCVTAARGNGQCSRNARFDWDYRLRGQVAPIDVDPYARRQRHYR